MPNVIEVLKERGFIEAMTSDELLQMTQNPIKVYCGFDPTAESLHLGNLVAIMGLAWFQRFGHTPVAIVGGATGMIGDPSGKTSERQLLDEQTLQQNIKGVRKNLETILDFNHPHTKAIILNNFDWFKEFSFIQFLRDVGKSFRLGPMLAKDSVRARLNSEEGMSFTEFSYQLLQGYDFLHLYQTLGVSVQLGGSDQWGNITAGTDLIRKTLGKAAYGITFPLLTRSDGQKFGKSEQGAIWLSPEKLSAYEFYQYLVRIADEDVIKLMRLLTFMDMEEIRKYETMMLKPDYAPRTAQKRLAEEITNMIHGPVGLQTALKVTAAAAPGQQATLDEQTLESIAADMPNSTMRADEVINQKLVDVLVQVGLQPSKGEAKRLIRNGGVYINNEKVDDENLSIQASQLIGSKLILLAAGKKNKMLIRLTETGKK
ncbi:MAG: tyrosine--tRNA ligase [Parachlamydiaceae bacterium]|nr:tyrosine--tRNA ligase [Parachlamydiaceae bacterium]